MDDINDKQYKIHNDGVDDDDDYYKDDYYMCVFRTMCR